MRPLFASDRFSGKSRRGVYGDVVEELDWSVGRILETLKKEKLDRKPLVFFSSDNGPWLIMNQQGGSAGLLRDGKGSTCEGGMHVPGIAWWPGKIPAGTVQGGIASTLDIYATSLHLAGAELPHDRTMDSVDLSGSIEVDRPIPSTVCCKETAATATSRSAAHDELPIVNVGAAERRAKRCTPRQSFQTSFFALSGTVYFFDTFPLSV